MPQDKGSRECDEDGSQRECDGEVDHPPGTQILRCRADEDDRTTRLDVFLARHTSEAYSRTYLQNLISEKRVHVDGAVISKASYRLSGGESVEVVVPPAVPSTLEPEPIPLDVVYEDDDLLVLNKQRDLVVHPAPGHYSGTLVHGLLHYCDNLSSINNIMRPGIVHRLDKDTTGLMVVAKNDTAHLHLSYQLQKRWMEREYLALVHGVPDVKKGKIEMRIGRDPDTRFKMAVVKSGGKRAVTWFRVQRVLDSEHALLRCQLETGRTHQIRVHLSYIGYPIVGDPLYAPEYADHGLKGQALHATRVAFEHPTSGDWLEFESSLPDDVADLIQRFTASN